MKYYLGRLIVIVTTALLALLGVACDSPTVPASAYESFDQWEHTHPVIPFTGIVCSDARPTECHRLPRTIPVSDVAQGPYHNSATNQWCEVLTDGSTRCQTAGFP